MACLDESEIAEYVDGVLPADGSAHAEAHIDACPACYQLVVQALAAKGRESTGDSTLKSPARTQVEEQRLSQGEDGERASGAVRVLPEAPSRYTILGLRGRGGQACVYAAYDEYLRREIALKVIAADAPPGVEVRESPRSRRAIESRFLREIGIASQLVHPSIVHVYDAGKRADGSLYYTMQLVQGTTLAKALKGTGTLAQRLALLRHFVDVCNAVAYAHSRGVLHRDIKPSNVMLGAFGETVVLDWGLAKTRNGDKPDELVQVDGGDATLQGAVFGTPRYMSPEQAAGGPLDERSDTWALGVVLFEILAGRPPFQGDTASAILREVREGNPPRVRDSSPVAPAELADIAEKALRREPGERYQNAKQLADDVTAYLSGRRVDAHEYTAWEVVRRFALQHKAAVTAALLVLSTLVLASLLILISYRNEHKALERESRARVEEHDARLLAQLRLSQSFATKARILGEEQDLLASRIYAAASLKNNPAHPRSPVYEPQFASRQPDSRLLLAEAQSALFGAEGRAIRRLAKTVPVDGILLHLAVSPDGKRLAGVGPDDGFRLWDMNTGTRIVDARDKEQEQNCVAFSPSSDWIATGCVGGKVLVRSARDGAVVQTLTGHADSVRSVAFSASGRQLASAGRDATVRLWNTTTWQIEAVLPIGQQISSIAYRPVTGTLAVGCRDGSVRLWDAVGAREVGSIRAHNDPVEAIAFSSDGERLVSGAQDRTAKVWNPTTGALLATLEPHREAVVSAAFSPDGRWIETVARDGYVRLWRASDYSLAQLLTAHRLETHDAAFLGGGTGIVTCGAQRALRQWEIVPPALSAYRGHKGIVFSVAFSGDGRWLASGGIDNTVRLWDVRTGDEKHRLVGHQQAVMRVAFSPDGSRVLSASRDRSVRVWSTSDGTALATWTVPLPVYALATAPDGRTVAMSSGGQILLRAMDGTGEPQAWESQQNRLFALAFSPDSATLASAGADGTVRLWAAGTHAPIAVFEAQKDWVTDVKFSPDGRWIGAAGKEGIATIWDLATRRVIQHLKGHRQWVNEVSFAANGTMAATSSDDRTAILWDLRSWEPLLVLPMEAGVSSVEFSPDSGVLVAASTGPIRRWQLDLAGATAEPAEVLEEAQRTAGQVLDGVRLEVGSGP